MVTETVPGSRSAAVGLWVAVGSRDEHPASAGSAHFLEHLLFKATPHRDAASLAAEVDAVGGEINAFTSKEHTCYYAHVLDTDLDLAVDVVTDVVLGGLCRPADVEVEREVVLEELAMRDDDPEDLVNEAATAALLGDHPLARPVLGTEDSVSAMTAARLRGFHRRRYTPERMVLAVAGNVTHAQVVGLARKAFAGRLDGAAESTPVRTGIRRRPGAPTLQVVNRDGEQSHLVAGTRAYGRFHPDRWALSVLNTAIGGGLSSRLFQEIREQRGLAYTVYSAVDTYADTGLFSVYAGCSPERLGEVATVARKVLEDVRDDGLTAEELSRAKGSLRGGLVLGLEDAQSRMHRIGRSEINYQNQRTVTRTLARIDKVSAADVNRVARDLLSQPFGGAVLGPHRGKRGVPSPVRNWLG
ncbi:peptidase M16 [Tsukamurella pulmonis]|uniref:Predicted Zn-dependent peptidase n=1 Tax=Tsukamurella pulmonis TaxID=47312 RepID=A0A1H1E2N1_9ACTN|nr:zinc protease [Tsukamurella pulmonis]BDD83088.1 peptidase M16 [Tsukamurella pulmonis]SDQ83031.1 Predicted Zn-dependent peptidase [Tsukamurella pulmonis]SUP21378.1 Protease 3 precursor [Tsukamurella pulmonis]